MRFEVAVFEKKLPEERYDEARDALAHDAVHGDLTPKEVRKRVEVITNDAEVKEYEDARQELAAVESLFLGMEAHDRASALHFGAWQKELAEACGEEKTLTKEEARMLFERFPLRAELLEAEEETLRQYEAVLAHAYVGIRASAHVVIDRMDVQGLVNDLRVRVAERIADDAARMEALHALDDELQGVIERVPWEERGKKLELQEIYVLRRLVHAADTGHLVSVEHGTLREDFRGDRGKVDLHVAVAGTEIPFQVKTFQDRVSSESVRRQEQIHARAKAQVAGTGTHLAVLQAEAIREVYGEAVRAKGRALRLQDKYEALQPLTDVLSVSEREALLRLTGMTEENFQEERVRFEENQRRMLEHQAAYFLKEAEKIKVFRTREQQLEDARRREEAAVVVKQEAIEAHKAAQVRAAEERIRTRAQAAAAKQRTGAVRTHEGLIEAERRAQEAARRAAEEAEKAAKRDAQRQKRMEKEAIGWPPKNFLGMLNAPLLQQLGFLSASWNNDARELLAAKKDFLQLFAKPKKGAPPTDKDAPNAFFKERFPHVADFESSSSASRAA